MSRGGAHFEKIAFWTNNEESFKVRKKILIKNLYIKLTFSKFVWNISWISHVSRGIPLEDNQFSLRIFLISEGMGQTGIPLPTNWNIINTNCTRHFCEYFLKVIKMNEREVTNFCIFIFFLKIHLPKCNNGEKPKIKF